jgi:ElaB/YqjD/DUF883 family membrane-anchored ribosome-binding protein
MSASLATAIAGNGAGSAKQAAGTPFVGTPFEALFDGVDDLIRRVADVENPEIRKIRARVHATMVAVKGIAADGATASGAAASGAAAVKGIAADGALDGVRANPVRPQAVQVAGDTDDYLRDYPGQALGVALLVGLSVSLIVSSRQ